MTLPYEYQQQENESFEEYKYRLIADKVDKLIDLDWIEIRDILGLDISPDTLRKQGQGIREVYRYYQNKRVSNTLSNPLNEIEQKTQEFVKEKYKYQDQKREYYNMLKSQARNEHLREEIKQAIKEIEHIKPLEFKPVHNEFGDKEGLVLFSDWHYGIEVDHKFNKYNKEVFLRRIEEVVSKTIEYGKLHNIRKLTVAVIGDNCSGDIHVSTKVQNNEIVIRQVQFVSEILAEIIAKLANEFEEIEFIHEAGNHGRTGKKDVVTSGDNYEHFIPWYIEGRLRHFPNIKFNYGWDTFVENEILGNKIVYVHGNYDYVTSIAKTFPQLLGYVPKYAICGHIHHNYIKEEGRTTIIANSSLVGMDDYALQKRYYAEPAQKFMVFNKRGIECTYNIEVD